MTKTELSRDLESTFNKKYISQAAICGYTGLGKKNVKKLMSGYKVWRGGKGNAQRYHINDVAEAISNQTYTQN